MAFSVCSRPSPSALHLVQKRKIKINCVSNNPACNHVIVTIIVEVDLVDNDDDDTLQINPLPLLSSPCSYFCVDFVLRKKSMSIWKAWRSGEQRTGLIQLVDKGLEF